MLDASKLSRKYGDFLAVDQVSFSIASGEIVGLLGHNGAGKTTIMKMLSGYLEPDSGSIHIDGVDIAVNPKQVQRRLGYLPENLPVYPELSVADYLDYAADLKGLSGELKRAEIKRAVAATELADKFLAPIATLSRGYRQRVGVAQAVLGNPRLLILDEPTNGLDPTQTEHMRQLIRELAKSATVILSTHIMQEVDALCDRVLIVRRGRLLIDEKLADLKLAHALELSSSLGAERLRGLLDGLPGLAGLHALPAEAGGEREVCRLSMQPGTPLEETAATVARRVVEAGASLYRLAPVVRNLESLFKDSDNEQREELDHAA